MMLLLKSPYPDGASAFSPPSLSGLQLWLHADALSLSDGDPVSSWTDSSGNGRHATQGTSGARPIYKTSILNGQPVVRFDGVDDYLFLGNLSAAFPSAATLFVVCTISGTGPGMSGYSVYGTGDNDAWWWHASGDGYQGAFRATRAEAFPSGGTNSGTHLFTLQSSASLYEMFHNGSSLGTYSAGYNAGTAHYIASLDVSGGPRGDRYLKGDIAEIVIYSSVLTGTDRGLVETYLNAKYAVY
jgi:hypothetical protein